MGFEVDFVAERMPELAARSNARFEVVLRSAFTDPLSRDGDVDGERAVRPDLPRPRRRKVRSIGKSHAAACALSTMLYCCSSTVAGPWSDHRRRRRSRPFARRLQRSQRPLADPRPTWSRAETIWLLHECSHARPPQESHARARTPTSEAQRPPAVKVPVPCVQMTAPSASRVEQAVHAPRAIPLLHSSSFSLGKKSLESSNWNENTAADPNRRNLAAPGRLVGQVTADAEQPRRFRGGDG